MQLTLDILKKIAKYSEMKNDGGTVLTELEDLYVETVEETKELVFDQMVNDWMDEVKEDLSLFDLLVGTRKIAMDIIDSLSTDDARCRILLHAMIEEAEAGQ